MSKRKKPDGLRPWLSAKPDNADKRFTQIGNSLLLDKRYQALSDGAKNTYQCMSMECGGKREFQFPRTAAKKYGISANSLTRHVKELVEAGFITKVSGANLRQPNEYAFSFEWKEREPN